MRIARVIVDVKASPTDNLYDYLIPETLLDVVRPGIRVIVPFGPRKVMGFVIALTNQSKYDPLREIEEVMDHTPILTEELIHLSEWMQKEYLCFRISALQVMLPAVFKASYKKEVWILNHDRLPSEWEAISEGKDVFPFEKITENGISNYQVSKLLDDNLIDIKYVVERKNKVKKETYVTKNKALEFLIEEYDQMKQAKKQKEILNYFIEHDDEILLKSLTKRFNTTKSPVDALVSKGLLKYIRKEVYRKPFEEQFNEAKDPLPLTDNQQQVVTPVIDAINEQSDRTFLLHGVTGSGKTEVYLQSIQHVIKEGKEAIVLVPEIALTPQMVSRFKARFGDAVAVMHSGLSIGEKYDEWRKIQRKEVKVVVGARSAVFAPFENLGIIIIDEEHETTYKQEDYPKYHAREVAKFRAKLHKCPVILGSATPTLESYARALKGNYQLLELTERIHAKPMPEVDIVDMRDELMQGNRSMFSELLTDKINDRLEKKEQIILLLNRRGHSTFVMCRECGETISCAHCDISMTYHKNNHLLKCHYCSSEKRMPEACPECQSDAIRFFGVGTQKVEEALNIHFPDANIIRMDVDTTSRKGAHERLLKKFENHEADILLGTQMIAKGLDFKNVTLVGVLAADGMLHLPDFRSAEKSFQLLTQVSGRAGRHELKGEVVVQTYTPDHYTVQYASDHDYKSFFNREMRLRKQFGYPPYYYLSLINVSHKNHVKVVEVIQQIKQILSKQLSSDCEILGPSPSPMLRIKNRYRYQCMVKYKRRHDVDHALAEVLRQFQDEINHQQLQLTIDFEPYHFT